MGFSRRSFLLATTAAFAAAAGPGGRVEQEGERALNQSAAADIDSVRRFIREQWKLTVRRSDPSDASEVDLPRPFTVPTAGKTFHYFFYWDTYFTSLGLLVDGLHEQARDNADNMIYLVEKLGFVPNISAAGGQNRTQLPVASALYADVFEWSGDRDWLAKAYAAIEREHAFFQAMRSTPCGLNRGYHHATPQELWNFTNDIKPRLPHIPIETAARLQAGSRALAECEVWDFTPRFHGRCPDFCPIDTNALLYLMELNAARICELQGEQMAGEWQKRATDRMKRLTDLCWNESVGLFFDYDWSKEQQGEVVSAANYFMLWTGAATAAQASRAVEALKQLNFPHGVTTCAPGNHREVYQWDHPNAWPPLQFAAMEGLRRYGFHTEAREIATRYVETVIRNFQTTGNLWEKYNAVTGGIDVRDEYEMPPMLGWTAGVFLHALELLASELRLPVKGEVRIP